jgi:hypothetical protein
MRPIATLIATVLLAGCGETREVRELRALEAKLQEDLAKQRAEVERLTAGRPRHRVTPGQLRLMGVRPTPPPAECVAPAPPKVGEGGLEWIKPVDSPPGAVSVAGKDRGALEVLRGWPCHAIHSLEMKPDGHWTSLLLPKSVLDRPTRPPRPTAPPPTPRSPLVMPDPSILSGAQGERLRAAVQRNQKELEDLDRLAVEARVFAEEQKAHELEAKKEASFQVASLRTSPTLADKAFGKPALLESGRLQMGLGTVKLSGKLAAGRTKEAVGAILPASFEVTTLTETEGEVALDSQLKP